MAFYLGPPSFTEDKSQRPKISGVMCLEFIPGPYGQKRIRVELVDTKLPHILIILVWEERIENFEKLKEKEISKKVLINEF